MTAIMIFSFFAAAFVDAVTSILFMTAIMLQIARSYRVKPIPFIIMVVFATNIGSSATVVSNPIGVLIALRSGLSFPDFLRWATPMSFVALIITMVLSFWIFRKPLAEMQQSISKRQKETAATKDVTKHGSIAVPVLLFVGTVIGLLTHKSVETALGLEPNVMLIGVALAAAGIVLFITRDHARQLVEKSVDWWTLTFFMLLFTSAGTLQYVGVTEHIAAGMVTATGGNINTLFLVTTWSIGILTAVMDNVLAVVSSIPVVGDLADAGILVTPLWWGMLLGGTVMGNLTIIGSTAKHRGREHFGKRRKPEHHVHGMVLAGIRHRRSIHDCCDDFTVLANSADVEVNGAGTGGKNHRRPPADNVPKGRFLSLDPPEATKP